MSYGNVTREVSRLPGIVEQLHVNDAHRGGNWCYYGLNECNVTPVLTKDDIDSFDQV
jgi:hypothetical protein